MNKKKSDIKQISIYKKFHCIGGSCSDSCCVGWAVDVDYRTCEKLTRIKKHPIANRVKQHVYFNEDYFSPDIDYCKIELRENKKCPFLNDEGLCDIQISFGEEALSNVCSLYPRVINRIDGIFERSMTVSCPEAARLILLEDKGLEFETVYESLDKLIITSDVWTDRKPYKNSEIVYLKELRDFDIWAIKQNNGSIWEKIRLLGIFHESLDDVIVKKEYEKIPKIIDEYRNRITNENVNLKDNRIPEEFYEQLMKFIELMDIENSVDHEKFKNYDKKFRQGIYNEPYNKIHDEYIAEYLENHKYIFENYLINDMFKNLYPFTFPESAMITFLIMTLKLGLIQFYLTGLSKSIGSINDEIVVDFIQAFSKVIEHHDTYISRVLDLFKKDKMIVLNSIINMQ